MEPVGRDQQTVLEKLCSPYAYADRKRQGDRKLSTKTFFAFLVKRGLIFGAAYDIITKLKRKFRLINLGVAQVVARYLGVVEAASSSLVTQTK